MTTYPAVLYNINLSIWYVTLNVFVLFPYRHVINCKYPQRQESNAMKKGMTEVTINETNQLYSANKSSTM